MSNVEVFTSRQSLEVMGDGEKVTALRVKDRESGAEEELSLDGIFVQIGLTPNSHLFKEVLETNRPGEIVTDKNGRTSVPGIYAAGDVTGLSGIWPNAMKQGQIAALNMCGIQAEYTDRYAMKNTMNVLRARHTLPRSRCCRGRRYRA